MNSKYSKTSLEFASRPSGYTTYGEFGEPETVNTTAYEYENTINGTPSEILDSGGPGGGDITNGQIASDIAELEAHRQEWEAPSSSFYGESNAMESVEARQKRMEILRKLDELVEDASFMYDYGEGPASLVNISQRDYDTFVKHMGEYHQLESEYDDIAFSTRSNANIPQRGGGTITSTNPTGRNQMTVTPSPNPSNISITNPRTRYR